MKTIYTTDKYDKWIEKLRDLRGKAAIEMRIRRLELGNRGDWKSISESVFELRIHHGPGYRVYCMEEGLEIIVLLVGGDKSTQSRDIKEAIHLAQQVKESL